MPLTPILTAKQAKGKSPLQKAALAMELAENIGSIASKSGVLGKEQAPSSGFGKDVFEKKIGLMNPEEISSGLSPDPVMGENDIMMEWLKKNRDPNSGFGLMRENYNMGLKMGKKAGG